MTEQPFSLDTVALLARQTAALYTCLRAGYQPSEKQILFFTLAWIFKEQTPKAGPLPLFTRITPLILAENLVATTCRTVALHLYGDSGQRITALKQESDSEWRALLTELNVKLRSLVRIYHCQQNAVAHEEALTHTLERLLKLIRKLVAGDEIEANEDALAFALLHQQQIAKQYNFTGPFQPYAERILHNELRRYLKAETKAREHVRSLEEGLPVFVEFAEELSNAEEETVQRQKLQQALPRLFTILETLPTKRQRVAIYTLAGRTQFWLALQMAEMVVPTGYPAKLQFVADEEISVALNMNANGVRVHRSQAYLSIHATDVEAGALFKALIDVHF